MPMQILDVFNAMAQGQLGRGRQLKPDEGEQQQHPQQHQFRTALLNGFGQFFIVILVVAGYQVYVLLESFLRPLAWAALTGTVLFPFKTILTYWGRMWIQKLKETNTPLAFGIVKTPFRLTDFALDYLGDIVVQVFRSHTTAILWALIISLLAVFFRGLLYVSQIDVMFSLYRLFGLFVTVAASNWVWSVVIAYSFGLVFFWERRYKDRICTMALPVHCAIAIHLTATFGAIAFPVVVFTGVVLGIGFLGELKAIMSVSQAEQQKQEEIQKHIDSWGAFSVLSPWNFKMWPALVGATRHVSNAQLAVSSDISSSHSVDETETEQNDKELGSEANRYLKTLLQFFVVVLLWKNLEYIPFLVVPTIYSYLKVAIPNTMVYKYITSTLNNLFNYLVDAVGDRKEAVLPLPMIGMFRMALYGDRKILNILDASIDEAAANLMIGIMFVASAALGIIVLMLVQQETSYMVRMSGEFMNKTITDHPEFLTWMPEGTQLQDKMQTGVDSVYVYAREFVGDALRGAIGGTNSTESDKITTEVLTVMDQIYHSFMAKNVTNITDVVVGNPKKLLEEIESNESLMAKAADIFSFSFLMDYVYEHFETLYSVFNSVTTILKENGALIASMATSIFSFIIAYFSQFLDFIFDSVFFLAALSLMLSLSGERYYPLAKVAMLAEYFPEAGNVATVIEQAISGIFNASFKMAAFYGIYTYTMLSIFDVYVRFIPAVVGGIFAVIPLFPTYIAVVPALIELVFIRQDYFLSALLAVSAYVPATFVDEVMYQEVKTAHPYMFGLSVAGGLMTMGIEGVVVGPIVLCAFVIVIELSRLILKPH